MQQGGLTPVEGVGAVDLRPPPPQAVPFEAEGLQVGGAGTHRMEGRAVVVDQAGDGELAGAGSAADLLGCLEDLDVHAATGEVDGGGEPVGPAADHDRRTHACTSSCSASVRSIVHCTSNGMGPLGNQGCSATASATL